MTETDNIKYLRGALVVTGLFCIFGVWPLTIVECVEIERWSSQ